MINKENLFNCVNKKFYKVVTYIEDLDERQTWLRREHSRFKHIISQALAKTTANEMLDRIGYNPLGIDGIYEESERREK